MTARSGATSPSLAAALLLASCGPEQTTSVAPPSSDAGLGSTLANPATLELVSEKKLTKVISNKDVEHYEGSGIVASGGKLFAAFDNMTRIASIDTSLGDGTLGPGDGASSQYEGITATDDGRFYAMVESASADDTRAEVVELDRSTAMVGRAYTEMSFEDPNEGFEGVAWLRVNGAERLLALCENNDCKDDDTTPGKGRVYVLALTDGVWKTERVLKLPKDVTFLNYSDLSIRPNDDGTYAVAVVSSKSAAVWMGTLTASLDFTGPSHFSIFPKTKDGEVQYCSVEGVAFLGPSVFAFVSDKGDGTAPCNDEDESIHLFARTE
jgi:hypothetical protein